jgi:Ca2+-binding RTX toxin-like protein
MVNPRQVAFIDPAVRDVDFLSIKLQFGIEPIVLDAARPALLQIAEFLEARRDVDVVHVIAHGQPGRIDFAAGRVEQQQLKDHAAELAALSRGLSPTGEIRLWACQVGSGVTGAAFVAALARATGVPVQASTRLVGAADLGGSWELDTPDGPSPPPPLTAAGVAAYPGVFATFTATAGTDTFVGTTASDTYVVTTGTVSALDTFDAGGSPGVDVIQIGTAGAGTSVDLSAAATDGVLGFVGFEAITFVNTSGTSTATFNAAQFGTGRISTTLAVTGTASAQGLVINTSPGASVDLSGWTFATWTSGTDTISINAGTGDEILIGSSQADRFVVNATNQVSLADRYDGGAGNDVIQIGATTTGVTVDLSAAATDGVDGFIGIDGISFINTSGTSTATFGSAQLGAGRISGSALITGASSTQAIAINAAVGGSVDLSGWTFSGWTSGTDTISLTGSTGDEILIGSSQADRLVVTDTSQVSVGDRYDGGAGNDVIQVGVAGAGTSIDLGAAASDGVNGFLSVEGLTFVNTSGTSTATLGSAQLGTGRISNASVITGTSSTQAIVINAAVGASLDLSGWTFSGWTSGTDTISITGSTGDEILVGSSQIDRFVVTDSNQVSAADRYSGGAGNDVIQIGTTGVGTSIDLSAAASDGVNGFVSVEGITFVNTSGTSTATLNAAQIGTGRISTTSTITGSAATQGVAINLSAGGSLDLSGWTFSGWTSGTDTISITGSTGDEIIVGSSQIDRFVVSDSNQVSAADRYSGGAGNDVIQIGVAGAGTSIDLSAAAADGVDGFLSVEGLTFVNTSGLSAVTLAAAQFGTGKIATATAITGTSADQAIAINVASGGSIDLTTWTFSGWTSGTDTISLTGSTGTEIIVGSTQVDRFVVSDSNQVSATDRYNGGTGNDILQVGVAGNGTSIDLSTAAADGVNGFLSVEGIAFANTSGTSSATLNAAQFGTGKIATTAAITGTLGAVQTLTVNVAAAGSVDLSAWTFTDWTSGTDTITVNGSTGAETLTGTTQAAQLLAGAGTDTLIVTNTNQVQAGDRYDGGDDADTLRIGTTTGTAIDLSAAATDGIDGFVNIERVTFVNSSGAATATFNAAQFGTGRISNTTLFTGTSQVQAISVNLSAGGSLDMSGWTFATWTSGTDIVTVTGSTGDETIVGSSQIDRFVVSDTNQVSAADRYNGAGGNDILQVGLAGAGTAIDFSAAASDGVNGFLSVEALTYVNTSGTSTATFNSAQFGTGKIATTTAITGTTAAAQALVVNMAPAGTLNMSGWTFANWTSGADTIVVNGSGGADTITGPTQGATILAGAGNDTLIVTATTQVQPNDRYDGGDDIDTLQIGTVGAGVAVSLTAAASDGVDGFVNIEAISFVNTSTTSTATFNASQFGAGKISTASQITGTAAGVQGLAVNLAAGNSLDLSGLTFVTWASGTDTISLTGSTGSESIVGTSQIDRFVVGATNQVSAGDRYDGGTGNDVIQVGATTAAVAVDLSAAAADGVNGFVSVEGILFVNSAGTSTATFNANQFGTGKISSAAIITGTSSTNAIVVNVDSGGTADLSGWTFPTWTSGTDTITVNGSSGGETFTGAIQGTTILAGAGNDTLIASNTTQVQAADRYDGGADNDTLQIGLAGAGTSISLTAAATNGIDGFVNIEGITFVNTSGTSTATFGSAQFGAGKISNTALITGTASTQALALNMATGGALDLSGWTFAGWTPGTDTITLTGSTGSETFVGSSQTDTLFVGATAQVSSGDRYDGGAGNDILQIGAAGGGVTIDFSAAATDGVNGFLNVEAVNFTNTSGTSIATFNAGQFGAGKISNAVAFTGTASTQALALNLSAGGSLDMSGWTFATWTSGTDTITITGSTGDEIIVASSLIDRFVVGASNQVTSGDRYNGGASNDILQIGLAGAGTSVDLSAAASDGINGFLSVEALAFVNTSGTSTATFNANQFGTGKIASTVAITGTASTNAIVVNVDSGGSADLSGWTFPTWTSGTDTITVNGAGGAETFTGAIQGTTILAGAGNDTLIVSNATQVQATDRYDGGADNDAVQIGLAGAGTSISLTAAASNGIDGFVNIEGITFVNTSGTSTATFSSSQFGAGKIATTSTITGTASTQTFAVTLPSAGSFDLSGFTFSNWTSGTDVVSVTGSSGADTIVGSGQIDTLTGAAGADTLTGGAGLDIYNFAAGSSALTIGGSGTSGTIAGYDTITEYAYGASAAVSEKLGYTGAAVVTSFTRAAASTLQLNTGATVKSHAISNGIVTFDDTTTFAGAVNLQSLSDVAAAVQYLQAHDIGATGSALAFKATIGGIGHTFVFIQGTATGSPDSSDSLIDLVNVSASSLTASSNQLTAFDGVAPPPPAAPTVAENAAGGINAAEAADGTVVLVSLSGTGAVAGDTLSVNWGGQVLTQVLTTGDILAGSVDVAVPPETIAAQGDGEFNVTASLTDTTGNIGANSPATIVSVDTVAPPPPPAPGVAENGAGGINASEASNGTQVVVDLTGLAAEAGDILFVNWGGQVVSRAVTGAEALAGNAAVQISPAVIAAQGDGTFDVTASLTDIAGNVGPASAPTSVTVDTVAPAALTTAPAVPESALDGLNGTEAADGTSVVVDLSGSEAVLGYSLKVNWGGQAVLYVLTEDDILAGTASVEVPPGTIALQGDGTVSVTASLIDIAGNEGAASPAASVPVDRTNPTVTVAIADGSLSDTDASSLVTFTFSEAPVDFTDADLNVVGGTITGLAATGDPLVWTAQFTATDGFTGTGSVTVVSDSYTDAALNLGGSGTDSVTIDRTNPTVTVAIADESLNDTDASSLVTFTFSEAPTDFTDADLQVVGGTVTGLAPTGDPLVWTAQFTATDGYTGTGSVTVVSDSYTDAALNLGGSGTDSVTIDRTNPTVTVAIADGSLSDTDTSSLVTFTFSEAPVDFTDADLDVVGGTITGLAATGDPLVWTAQFTATDGFTGTGSVTVVSNSYTDAALNLGGSGTDSVAIDRTNPTVTVAIADGSLSDTDASSLVTFTFSEAPVDFTDADLDVVGGTITGLAATGDPLVWTAQFTATDGYTGTGSVTVVSNSYTDAALNLGGSGTDSVAIDRTNPTVTVAIADGSLSDADASSLVTFTFSEAPVGFTDADLDVVGGTVTGLAATGDPLVWTAQFTATDGFTGTGSVTIVSNGYTDAALNLGGSGSDSVTVDRTNPTVTVAIADGSLSDTDASSLVTFTFSEAPVDFTDADLDVVGGTITGLAATADPLVWTAQFTATDGFTGTGSVTVVSDSYTDTALNLGGSGSDSVAIDRTNPTVTVAIADGSLSDSDASSLVTFTFSEAPVDFSDTDLQVVGGTVTGLAATGDPRVWTGQFTATDGFTGTGSVTVVSDSYTDAALNLGGSGSDSVTIDRTNPTVTVAIDEASLSDGTASSLVTFTFSEAPVDFTDADLDVVGGTITGLAATGDPLVWTAQFTATDGYTGTSSVTVVSDSYTDAALNLGGSGTDSVAIDRTNPTVTVAIADGSLSDTDASSLVTFTFSEAPVDFTDADLDVVGGTITGLAATGDPLVWTAQFTATDGYTGTGSVTVVSDSYTDAALNLGGSGTDSVAIDRANPTVTVAIADGSLSDTDASSLVTFTFSEAPVDFTDADLDVVGGTITGLAATGDPLVWTAQFTATDGYTGTGSVTVVSDSYTDAALNLGGSGTDSVAIDRANPTVTVAIADGSLSDTDASSLVTFTFSEAPVDFTDADFDVVGGTVTGLAATGDPLVWTAQFTATDGYTGTGSVTVVSDSYTDAALNLGGSGSDSVTIDRANPTVSVAIDEASLSDGTASSLVTFTFSEAPVDFSDTDLQVVGGTVTGLAATGDPRVWTGQFTATDGFTGTGSVTVVSDSYTDAALNLGGSGSDSVTIDRANPTVTVAIDEASLSDGTASSLVTFTFSEAPVGFTNADLDVVGGTITGLAATGDPLVWTAQFTATDGFTGTGSVTVVSDSYTDAALNLGGSGSDSVAIDRTNPTVTVAIADGSLSDTDASSLVTFTFSEAPVDFTDADLDVVGGIVTGLAATGDPLVWTAQFTATDGYTGTGSVTVVSDSYTDAALNLGGSGTDSVTVDRTNPTVTVAIADGSLSDSDASSLVTFTFSEAPTDFSDTDLDVVGGTITGLAATGDPQVWTAQFTATDGYAGTGSVTVVSDSYTDAALNLGGSGTDSVAIDRTNPTVTVAIADGSLNDSDASSLVTFTFSEPPTDFTDADLQVVGGTVTGLAPTVDPLVWTAQFTATDGYTGTGSVTVVSNSYTDAALNLGGSGTDSVTVDRTNPTVTVAIADGSLSDTDASFLVTFTFSEAPVDFTDADLDVVGGTVTGLAATGDPLVWTAQFTATDGFAGTGSVSVVTDSYTDAALNLGGSGSDSVTVDRANPTVTVAIADGSLSDSDASSLVTFTFSEAPTDFTDADLQVVGGTVTGLAATGDPLVWTAQFTATDGYTGTGSVTVVSDSYTDAALNLGGSGTDSVAIDRTNPTVTVAIADGSLSDTDASSLVTFTFSEAPVDFTDADLDVVGGTITGLAATGDPLVWTAQFTATDGYTGTSSVTVVSDSYTDAALNLGGSGTDSVAIDRTADADGNLVLSIPDTAINAVERTGVVFSVSGIDPDVVTATVTFTDSLGNMIVVAASAGVVDMSPFVSGTVTSALTVVDSAGNLDSLPGPAIALDAVNGTSGNDTIYGTALNETFDGRAGHDTLYGREGDDTLIGGTGNDQLIGGTGADTLTGGLGSDTYYIDDAGDEVIEAAGQGTDTIYTYLSTYALGDDVEYLRFIGSGDFTGTGNGLANRLRGNAGDDTLDAGAGNDRLDGDAGADVMTGGLGDDTYYVDDIGDEVIEAGSEGSDTVYTSLSTYVLGDNVERLVFTGSGDFTGTGNGLGNRLYGGAGDDELNGEGGNDRLYGGTGADELTGGLGDDAYYVDDAGDVVIEAAGQGSDTVYTSLATYDLGDNVERLAFTGSGDFTGTGNGLANRLYGGAGDDTLDAGAGNDRLYGGAGADEMTGGLGNDQYYVDNVGDEVIEFAGQGLDTIFTSLSTYSLGDAVERLGFTGSGAFTGTGNGLANTIVGGVGDDELKGEGGNDTLQGGEGSDVLIGGLGADTLAGGGGADAFVYREAAESTRTSRDTIVGFTVGTDSIDFTEMNTGGDFHALQTVTSLPATIDAQSLVAYVAGGNTVLYVNDTGAAQTIGNASMQILLTGVTTLGDADLDYFLV